MWTSARRSLGNRKPYKLSPDQDVDECATRRSNCHPGRASCSCPIKSVYSMWFCVVNPCSKFGFVWQIYVVNLVLCSKIGGAGCGRVRDAKIELPPGARLVLQHCWLLHVRVQRRVPTTRNPKPETRIPKPETRNSHPGTRNPKPETRNPKPETRDPRPETQNPKLNPDPRP